MSDEEHLAFLTFWISHYLTCPPSYKVVKFDLPFAQALATDHVLPLGHFVLSQIYYGCFRLISPNLVSWEGPLWILRLWVHLYFPQTSPVCDSATDPLIYGQNLTTFSSNPQNFKSFLNFFFSLQPAIMVNYILLFVD